MHPSSDLSENKTIFPQAHSSIRWINKLIKSSYNKPSLTCILLSPYLYRIAQIASPLGEIKTSHTLVLMHFLCNCPFFLITQNPVCLQIYVMKTWLLPRVFMCLWALWMADDTSESHMTIILKNCIFVTMVTIDRGLKGGLSGHRSYSHTWYTTKSHDRPAVVCFKQHSMSKLF